MFIYWIDLPKLKTFKTGERSFYRTTSLTLSSITISFSSIDVPFINGHYKQGYRAWYYLDIGDCIYDESNTVFIYSSIVSSNLKDVIIHAVLADRWETIVIG